MRRLLGVLGYGLSIAVRGPKPSKHHIQFSKLKNKMSSQHNRGFRFSMEKPYSSVHEIGVRYP